MRHFCGTASANMSMGLPMRMSMTMSLSMSQSMTISMAKVTPISPHILYVPPFPRTASEIKHPTFNYEPSSVRLDSLEVTEVSSVLLECRYPSVTATMVASPSVTLEAVPKTITLTTTLTLS